MARVVVVGAGVAGLATAARLAKLGHAVTVCERNRSAGGMVRSIQRGGFRWDAGPASTTLPAVLRDLFRKSGRPLEHYVDLQLRPLARRHVFSDGSVVDLPTGSRAAQIAAVDAGLGRGSGGRWAEFVDRQGATWQTLRADVLDLPDGGRLLGSRAVARQLGSRTSLATLLRRSFTDDRLALMVSEPYRRAGSDPRQVPSFGAVTSYVERSFGVWSAPGGMAELTTALVTRLGERKVDVRYGCPVRTITLRDGRVTGVVTTAGHSLDAEVVVTAIDARVVFGQLLAPNAAPRASRRFARSTPAPSPAVTHLGLAGAVAELPDEVVFHGESSMVLTTSGSASPGHHAWTIQWRDPAPEDVLATLKGHGIDVRAQVQTRIDRTPADLSAETRGASYGTAWDGWRPQARRAALDTGIRGLHLVGASVHPGSSLPYAVWGAAHVAARLGKA